MAEQASDESIAAGATRGRSGGRNLTFSMLEDLGRAIVTGAYKDARFPTEEELTSRYGVSRTVTREAVKMLTAKGLLKARARAGTVVQPPDAWSILDPDVLRWLLERTFSPTLLRHFSELRAAIEPQAAALAAVAAPASRRAAIGAALDRMALAETGDGEVLDADIAFHIAVLEASANPFFLQFREMVSTALRTSIRFTNRFAGRSADVAAHRAVYTAIEARAPEQARAAMSAIIGEVMEFVTRSGVSDPPS